MVKIQSNFVIRTVTGSFFVLAILVSMQNFWSFSIVMSVMWILMVVEYYKLLKKNGNSKQKRSVWWSFFAYFYIILPLVCLIYVYSINPWYALALFSFVWVNDTFAYLVGIKFGKHKLFERISPKKTWEGFFGGLVFAIIAGLAFSYFLPCGDALKTAGSCVMFNSTMLFKWVGMAVVVVVAGTFGDLFESYLKRSLNVKDSGTILPGHGGLLDRLDSILFAAPAAMIYLLLLG